MDDNQPRYIPVFDNILREQGLISAAIYGVIWRHCQQRKGYCYASQSTIAEQAGLSRKAVNCHIKKLIDAGYIKKDGNKYTTCNRKLQPVTESYSETDNSDTRGVTESYSSVTEGYSNCNPKLHPCNPKLHELSIKINNSNNNIKINTHTPAKTAGGVGDEQTHAKPVPNRLNPLDPEKFADIVRDPDDPYLPENIQKRLGIKKPVIIADTKTEIDPEDRRKTVSPIAAVLENLKSDTVIDETQSTPAQADRETDNGIPEIIKNPGAFRALQDFEAKQSEKPHDPLADYPEDVRPVVSIFRDLWKIKPPDKRDKQFGKWIADARAVKDACGEYGLSVIETVYKNWREKWVQGQPPYTISSLGSIVKTCSAQAGIMRQAQRTPTTEKSQPTKSPQKIGHAIKIGRKEIGGVYLDENGREYVLFRTYDLHLIRAFNNGLLDRFEKYTPDGDILARRLYDFPDKGAEFPQISMI